MGMSEFYGPTDEEESLRTLQRSFDLGMTFLDTSDAYGRGHNEQLVGKAIKGRRGSVVVATKFGIVRTDEPPYRYIRGDPEYVRTACEASLQRLDTDHIDLYYLHRADQKIPIEETIGAMAELVAQGKVRHLGLSETAAETLRRASAVHPIAALQSEWSLWSRDIEDDIVPAARELGIGLVPYSPLGRGFLTGQITSPEDLEPDDFRRMSPRFQGENFARNLDLVEHVKKLAAEKGCTPSQLALAWLLAQGDDVVPIPGTKRVRYLEENAGAFAVVLDASDLAHIEEIAPRNVAFGDRYSDMRTVDVKTPQ
jgi:aryl-alcohol dehydrogenase-like predicted oxidoreductase